MKYLREHDKECDWLYQDFLCKEPGSCVIASPGYPGLYPPNKLCKYHITTSSIQTLVHITFTALLLPYNHCSTDYVAIYQGSTPSSPLLSTVCANRKARFTYSGPKLLMEFSSGNLVPPYDYNGFLATLEFTEKITTPEPPPDLSARHTEPSVMKQVDGTLRPDTLCDVDYYGLSSPRDGHLTNPGSQQLFWNFEGPLRCSQRFIPAANQSVTLTVTSLARLSANPNCHTLCGDSGCRCVTKVIPLTQMDHLAIITDQGHVVSCLCGDFQQQWLPVSLRSWSPMRLVYSVAHYNWNMQGFSFTAEYSFITDAVCGYSRIMEDSGEIHSRNISAPGVKLNHYYHQDCIWLLDSKSERQLTVELATEQSRPCTAWNLTAYKYDPSSTDSFGEIVHTFCPRDRRKEIALPWKLDTILLRLRATTSTAPEYVIRWRSETVRANTRIAGPTIAPSTASEIWVISWYALLLMPLWSRT
ncbi:Uncharacterized protein GBIM_06187 [Gryllus bimaculatus]|nr:Uncharacterized protein GBIM_06187 [Gryllus bimaculatus]